MICLPSTLKRLVAETFQKAVNTSSSLNSIYTARVYPLQGLDKTIRQDELRQYWEPLSISWLSIPEPRLAIPLAAPGNSTIFTRKWEWSFSFLYILNILQVGLFPTLAGLQPMDWFGPRSSQASSLFYSEYRNGLLLFVPTIGPNDKTYVKTASFLFNSSNQTKAEDHSTSQGKTMLSNRTLFLLPVRAS